MRGLEALLGAMGDSEERDTIYPTGDELATIRANFVHIPELKAGDKLRWKALSAGGGDYQDKKAGGNNGVFEVFRVLSPYISRGSSGGNHEADECDFTVLSFEEARKGISEFTFDSRRFERVAE